jgi:SAM-dependent methyltransferase
VARGRRPRAAAPGARGSAIHRGLVGERALVGTAYLADPALRQEYARDIAPRTRAALGKILAEVYSRDPGGVARPARALDLGTGTGAAAEALRAWFGADLDIVGVDRVGAPGVVTANLAVELPRVDGRFDLIVAAHLLGELYVDSPFDERVDARARRVRVWADELLAPGGTVVIVEPALRETSRELLAVRDQLLAMTDLAVVAPCFWTGACPALANPRDWCHDAVASQVASDVRRVDFSYLVLRDRWRPIPGDMRYRVVSDALPEKGRLKLYACGPTGRHPFIRLDRHESPANAAFAELARGDTARIAGATRANDGHRVEATTAVQKI